ncbi:protein HIDE1 isoform X2 [Pleurodeles waltl]|uniref:protein HIDE1 isoform X2 n=1 Tax=Pleurodeles waltl TaxID=8319 RepID=UPI00370943CC
MPRSVLLLYLEALPPPEIALDGEGPAVRIRCTAASAYPEGMFFLYREGQATPVEELHAPKSRHSVTFSVPRAARPARYRCIYRAWSSGQLRTSEASSTLTLDATEYTTRPPPATQDNATVKDAAPAWVVPVSVGGAVALLLVIALVAVVAVKCVRAARKQKQREKESCWTQNTDISKTNLAFRGSILEDSVPSYGLGTSRHQNPTDNLEPNTTERMQLPSRSHFSTFRT